MSRTHSNDDQKAWEWLAKIYDHWTRVSFEGNEEFRSPKNRFQIWYSRYWLRRIKALNYQDDDVVQRLVDIEDVVDSVSAGLPNYTWKIVRSLAISLFILGLFYNVQYNNTTEIPQFSYDTTWYTMAKNGYITSVCYVPNNRVAEVQDKVFLKKGTKVIPLGQMGTEWIQVKTPDGQIGFVNYKNLEGSQYMEADEDAKVFNNINDQKKKILPEGTPVKVIGRKIIKRGSFNYEYVKLRINEDSIAWGLVYDFRSLMFDQIPYINQGFRVRTTKQGIQDYVLGQHIDTIQKRFGTATSLFMNKSRHQAYYKFLVTVDDRTHYRSLNIQLNKNGIAVDTNYLTSGKKKFYDRFPLMSLFYNYRISTNDAPLYSDPNSINYFQWWDDFKSINWITWIIGWIVKIIMIFVVLILVFCIPRGLVSPLLNFFAMTRFLPNFGVIIINTLIYLFVSYMFFLYATQYVESWLIPAIGTIVMYAFFIKEHISNINYNRCPSCHTIYASIDKGSTFKGRTRKFSVGTYDKDLGTTVDYERNKRITTSHYERRAKLTTTTTEKSVDHLKCSQCGYNWDIYVEEETKSTKYF